MLIFILRHIFFYQIILFLIMQLNQIKINPDNLIFLLLLTMPICAIAGNLFINLNIVLTSIIGIFILIKNQHFHFLKETSEIILLSLFFLVIFLFTIFFQISVPKTFLLIKFLFFTITIVYFLKNNENSLSKIFLFYGIVCFVLSVDVIFQSYFSKNILGYINIYEYNSSFYGEEKLAGFHILFFSFFTISFLPGIFKKKIYRNLFLFFIFVIIPFSIFLSLNRISLITYFMGLLIFFILSNPRKRILIILSLPVFLLLIFSHPDQKYINKFQSFLVHGSMIIERTFESYSDINELVEIKKNNSKLEIEKRYTGSGHAVLFSTAFFIWKDNKWFGVGYKQFYEKCRELNSHICSTHPHNIFLDILVSFGILGALPFLILLLTLFKKSIRIIISNKNDDKFLNCLFVTNIMFFFPLQSSGSILKSYLGFFAFTLIALSIFYFNKVFRK